MLFSVLYYCTLNIFGFCIVAKQAIYWYPRKNRRQKKIDILFFSHSRYNLLKWKKNNNSFFFPKHTAHRINHEMHFEMSLCVYDGNYPCVSFSEGGGLLCRPGCGCYSGMKTQFLIQLVSMWSSHATLIKHQRVFIFVTAQSKHQLCHYFWKLGDSTPFFFTA